MEGGTFSAIPEHGQCTCNSIGINPALPIRKGISSPQSIGIKFCRLGFIACGKTATPATLPVTVLCQENTRSTTRAEFRVANETTVLNAVFRPLGRGIRSISHHSSPPSASPASSADSSSVATGESAEDDLSSPLSSEITPWRLSA